MQKSILNISLGAILGVLVTLLLLNKCNGVTSPCPETTTNDTIKTKEYDSVPKYINTISYLPSDSFIVEIPQLVDTLAILDRYFKAYVYDRFFENDSVKISFLDTISQNRITGSSWLKYQFLFPIANTTIVNTTLIDSTKKQRTKIMFGITAGGNKQGLQTIAPEIILITKKNYLFKLGYNILRSEVQAGIGYTPQLKRN